MKRINSRARELLVETLVGAFMFVVLLSLGFFTIILSRENFFAKTFPLEVVFADVMGLRDGDNVVIRGMTVGKVKELRLQDDGVHVFAQLQRPVHFYADYAIRVVPTSVLGGRYLQLDEGTPAAGRLAEDTQLRGETPRDLLALASEVVADFKDISAGLRKGEGTLGKLIKDDELYKDARDILAAFKQAVSERGLLTKLENTAGNLDEITTKINKGEGTLGKLVNDDKLYQDATGLVSDVRKTVDDFRETSPLVTFTTILFGAL